MLKIINDLRPFFEDCYGRINVRQYARIMKITAPTASKLLKYYEKKGLLIREKDRNYIMFHANRDSKIFIGLSRMYWQLALTELVNFLESGLANPAIVLFGSLAKAEAKPDSDIDLAIFGSKKSADMKQFERKLGRKIQVFRFDLAKEMPEDLANGIINGHILSGRLEL